MSEVYNADDTATLTLAYTVPNDGDAVTAASVRTSIEAIADDVAKAMAGKVTTTANFDPTVVERISNRWHAKEADFVLSGLGRLVQQTTGGTPYAYFDLELPDGCVLSAVRVYVDPDNVHGALPASMPKLIVYKLGTTQSAPTQLGTTATDSSGSVGAYETPHSISVVLASPETINAVTTRYFARFEGETGANSATGLAINGVESVFSVSVRDVGAA